ncbi:MAG TPA: ABC transporter ATP-binding protein [Candidatus Paceibacterota bacterium]
MTDIKRNTETFSDYVQSMKDSFGVFKWIWVQAMTSGSRSHFRRILYWNGGSLALQALLPMCMAFLFKGLSNRDLDMIILSIEASTALALAIRLAESRQEKHREYCIGLNMVRAQSRISDLFLEKSLGQHSQESQALSASTVSSGKWKMIDLQFMVLFGGTSIVIQTILSVIVTLCFDWVAGLIMVGVVLCYFSWSLFLNYRVAKVCDPIEKAFKALFRRADERHEHCTRVKTSGHENQEVTEMNAILEKIMERDRTFWLWFISQSSARAVVNIIGFSCVLAWVSYEIWTGARHVGFLFPLSLWASRIADNLWHFDHLERHINKYVSAVKPVLATLDMPPDIADGPDSVDIDGSIPHRIEFRDVGYSYKPSKESTQEPQAAAATLRGIDLVIEKGRKVAVIGESGAGKTTLMKLLMRFADPAQGSILIDDVDTRRIRQTSYLRSVGYAAQAGEVFDGTIRDNLLYGLTLEERAKMTDEKLMEIMRLMKADFKSLDTIVGTRGLKLSGGQAQRLLLAAAVVKNPWLLVIDEGTANLDARTERQVQQGLAAALTGDRSAVIITHRLSTVRQICDTFVVLRAAAGLAEGESQIEAIAGSFEELYELSPTFRCLADEQGVQIKQPAL